MPLRVQQNVDSSVVVEHGMEVLVSSATQYLVHSGQPDQLRP